MNEIIPNLWIGDLPSSLNYRELRQHKIFAILSAMRGSLSIHQSFTRLQIEVDDTEDADIMRHFLPSVHFIQAQLDKGRGVLVHCQAGVSRSAAIVAAYLIFTRNINADEALNIIKQVRPFVEPNANFLRQLDLFQKSKCDVSGIDKDVRRFYLDRTVKDIMNGDGSQLEEEMLPTLPNPSSGSINSSLHRRIRCKMCRQELATLEHILDHGQLEPETQSTSPATTWNSPPSAQNQATEPVSALVSKTREGEGPKGPSNSSQIDREPATRLQSPTNELSNPSLAAPRPSCLSDQQDPNQSLINPKCSGYFVEPLKWMSHFLSAGELSGKITCPNKKCGAKLGNYDWAGVCCGCKGWVTPGFCINRSKVDEVVII